MARSRGTWVKGQSGNPNGRPRKGESLTDLMRKFLEHKPEGMEMSNREAFITRVYHLAMQRGDTALIKLIWNYLDGMPVQKEEREYKGEIKHILTYDDAVKILRGNDQRAIPEPETSGG